MLDYDGTLTPIKKHPRLARLTPKRKLFLQKLAAHPRIRMAVISGRKLADLKAQVRIPGLIYAGNHGFEIEANGRRRIHPAAKRFRPILKRIRLKLLDKIRIKGVWIEDKGLTFSLHYRQMAQNRLGQLTRSFLEVIGPWKKKVRITTGKKVFEIRPPFDWDKGKAVKWVIDKLKLKARFPIYIGDDRTDEDAFKVLKGKGIAVWVGRGKPALADFSLKDPNRVYAFLDYLRQAGAGNASAFWGPVQNRRRT